MRARKPVAKITSRISLRGSDEEAFTRISVYFDACKLNDQMSRHAINSPAKNKTRASYSCRHVAPLRPS